MNWSFFFFFFDGLSWFNWQHFFLSLWDIKVERCLTLNGTLHLMKYPLQHKVNFSNKKTQQFRSPSKVEIVLLLPNNPEMSVPGYRGSVAPCDLSAATQGSPILLLCNLLRTVEDGLLACLKSSSWEEGKRSGEPAISFWASETEGTSLPSHWWEHCHMAMAALLVAYSHIHVVWSMM